MIDQGLCPSMKRAYSNLHGYNINSISISQNGENFISSDDLGIYLWDLEEPEKTFLVVDIKPEKIDELNEVITCSKMSPYNDYNIAYGTSKAIVKLLDLRERSDFCNGGIKFDDSSSKKNKNFFTEIITSVSDV